MMHLSMQHNSFSLIKNKGLTNFSQAL